MSARVVLDDHLDVDGHGDLSALGATHQGRLEAGQLDIQVLGDGGQHVAVNTLSGDLEVTVVCDFGLTCRVWPGFTRNEGRSTILPSTRM